MRLSCSLFRAAGVVLIQGLPGGPMQVQGNNPSPEPPLQDRSSRLPRTPQYISPAAEHPAVQAPHRYNGYPLWYPRNPAPRDPAVCLLEPRSVQRYDCPGLESNQHVRIRTQAPQACASANSATRALLVEPSVTRWVDGSTGRSRSWWAYRRINCDFQSKSAQHRPRHVVGLNV